MKKMMILLAFFSLSVLNIKGQNWSPTGTIQNNSCLSIVESGDTLYTGGFEEIFMSTDLGANWIPITSFNNSYWVQEIKIANSIIFACSGRKLAVSPDMGNNWNFIEPNILPATTSIITIEVVNDKIFLGTQYDGIITSTLAGISDSSWSSFNAGLCTNQIYCLKNIGLRIYAGTYGDGVFMSPIDSANFIATSGMDPVANFINTIHLDSTTGVMYAGNLVNPNICAIYRSTDLGQNWIPVIATANIDFAVYDIKQKNGVLYAGINFDGCYKSVDGNNWLPMNSGLTSWTSNSLLFSITFAGGYVFASNSCGVWRYGYEPVGTEENQNSVFMVYPNPTTDYLNLSEETFCEIYNLVGEKVFSGKQKRINVSGLQTGIYLLKTKKIATKFIKE